MRAAFAVSAVCWVGGCSPEPAPAEPEPTPVGPQPTSIQITASADSLFRLDPQQPVHFTATVLDQDGAPMGDQAVTWSTDGQFTLETTGPRSAMLSWNFDWNPVIVTPVVVTAAVDTVQNQHTIQACPADRAIAQASGTMIAGRSQSLSGTVVPYPAGGYHVVLDVPLSWSSSSTEVLSVAGNHATALAPGTAVLTASACGRTDTVSVQVLSAGYAATPIFPAGATAATGKDLNDSGQIVGTAISADEFSNFLWTDGSFTGLGDCVPLGITNDGRILCQGAGPRVWQNGSATALDTISGTFHAINDLGWTAGFRSPAIVLWKSPSDILEIPEFGLTVTALNDAGHIIGQLAHLYGLPALWINGERVSLPSVGRGSYATAINDSGDVVGFGEVRPGGGSMAFRWRAPEWQLLPLRGGVGSAYNDLAQRARDVNNLGAVVGVGSRGAFVWSEGRLSLLANIAADDDWTFSDALRINEAGQILAIGIRASTGFAGPVLLTPPSP